MMMMMAIRTLKWAGHEYMKK